MKYPRCGHTLGLAPTEAAQCITPGFFNNPLLKLINIQNGVTKKKRSQECFVYAINLIANLIARTILGNGFTRAELTASFLVCQEWVRSFYTLR